MATITTTNPVQFDNLVQGNDWVRPIVYSAEGSPSNINLTGCTISGSVTNKYGTVLTTFDIVNTNLALGQFSIGLSKTKTNALPVQGAVYSFHFDVRITFADTTVKTILFGDLKVRRKVTQ